MKPFVGTLRVGEDRYLTAHGNLRFVVRGPLLKVESPWMQQNVDGKTSKLRFGFKDVDGPYELMVDN